MSTHFHGVSEAETEAPTGREGLSITVPPGQIQQELRQGPAVTLSSEGKDAFAS